MVVISNRSVPKQVDRRNKINKTKFLAVHKTHADDYNRSDDTSIRSEYFGANWIDVSYGLCF